MKFFSNRLLKVLLLSLCLLTAAGADEDQGNFTLSPGDQPGGTKLTATPAHGRVYFFQMSADGLNWAYAPTVKLGTTGIALVYEVFPLAGQKYFYRLKYTLENSYTTGATGDVDGDTLSNSAELTAGTDPFNPDTDGDGIWDGREPGLGLNPLLANSDANGIPDCLEFLDPNPGTLLVSEYQASNKSTLPDEDGDYSDWLEIQNPTPASISLDGWKLSDAPDTSPSKWFFPNGINLTPGQSLVVFASDKNRRVAGQLLHTNFKFDSTSDRIGLINPAGVIVDRHDWSTVQVTDTSAGWGIDNESGPADGKTRKLRVFSMPTPGQLNTEAAYLGVTGPPAFSINGGVFSGGPVSVTLTPNAPAQTLRYTTDFTLPTSSSTAVTGPISISTTTILRVQAFQAGKRPSAVVTRSFLFKEKVLGTAPQGTLPTDHQIKPAGWPEATTVLSRPIDYAMTPFVISDHKNDLNSQLSAIPTISLVLRMQDFFSKADHGIYVNSAITDTAPDPTGGNWERLASVEFINPSTGTNDQESGWLSIAGGSGIQPTTTPKHGMKIDFRKKVTANPEGVMNFQNQPFGDSLLTKFRTLMLRNPTHDSWTLVWGGPQRDNAAYVKEAWARSTHAAMGHQIARRRWVHLYIDGLYWGVYELGERINQDYMRAYGVPEGSYDVLKQFGAIEDGDDIAYMDLLNKAVLAAGDPGNASKWAEVTDRLDMNNYIDYLMVNQYAYNTDWPGNNWRAARRRDVALGDPQGKFRFFVWDAEFTMNLPFDGDNTAVSGGAAGVHSILLTHPSYKLAWKGRVAAHFDTPGGVFSLSGGTDAAVARFTAECTLLDGTSLATGALLSESARWGDGGGAYLTRTNWLSATANYRNNWLTPRRASYRTHLVNRGLANP